MNRRRKAKGRRPKKKTGGPPVDHAPITAWMPRGPHRVAGHDKRGWQVYLTPEPPSADAVPVTIIAGHHKEVLLP